MPYIPEEDRNEVQARIVIPSHPGELNYLLTDICLEYIALHGEKYQYYNDVIGALESCKLEFYRRAVAPYEDLKKEINGDVYFSEKQ